MWNFIDMRLNNIDLHTFRYTCTHESSIQKWLSIRHARCKQPCGKLSRPNRLITVCIVLGRSAGASPVYAFDVWMCDLCMYACVYVCIHIKFIVPRCNHHTLSIYTIIAIWFADIIMKIFMAKVVQHLVNIKCYSKLKKWTQSISMYCYVHSQSHANYKYI